MRNFARLSIVCVLIGCGKPASPTAPDDTPTTAPTAGGRARALVRQWLNDEKRGDGHLTPWCNWAGTEAFGGKLTLHAVRSYEIQSVTVEPDPEKGGRDISLVRFRADYSDRDGRQVTKDHMVYVRDYNSGPCLIGGR